MKIIAALIIITFQYYFPFNNRKAKVDQDQVQEIKYSFFLCEEEVTDDEDRARYVVYSCLELVDYDIHCS